MDAPSLTVLSCWADAAMAQDAPQPGLPASMLRLPGCAASPEQALRSACDQHPGRDVLLLRVDAELPAHAWERLVAAWAGSDWDVLSPVDGRWRLFPDDGSSARRDALAWSQGEHAVFASQGWSTTCSLWRGERLAAGLPAAGEPLRAGLLPCLYVGPALPTTGDELPLPLAALHARMTAPGAVAAGTPGRPVVLHVLHDWGGGAERFVRDLQAGDRERQHLVLVARGDEHRAPFGRRLCLHMDLDAPPLRTWTLANPIINTSVHSPEVQAILSQLVAQWGVGAVLVSSLIGHSLDALRTGLPTALCAHDAYPAWPLLHDVRDPTREAFDPDALARGLATAGPAFVLAGPDAATWWRLREQYLLALAQADVTLVAPSEFARRRLQAIAPALAARRWQVIPHGLAPLSAAPGTPPMPERGSALQVLVPGRIQGEKGERLLSEMLENLPADVELVLLGCGHRGERFEGRARVRVHRDYQRDDLPQWVARLAPDLALLPSTVPETFSYTLSEMLALGIPAICTSAGAPAERLADAGGGWAVAPEASAVNALLARLAADRSEIAAMQARPRPSLPGLEVMAQAWRDALPTAPASLRLASAAPALLVGAALQVESSRLRAQLARNEAGLREASLELDRRAEWAHGLQEQLATAQQRMDEINDIVLKVARLEDSIKELDQQLAEAHGYYQRDSNDLARQRDIALAQRDEAVAGLKQVLDSTFWRATAWPRMLAQGARNQLLALVYHLRHLHSLASRGQASLRNRGLDGTLRRLRERRAARTESRGLAVLPGPAQADSALRLPRPKTARASIIIPVYNQLHYTLACLRALADCGDHTPFEVIVVDDGSSDGSPRVLPSIPGLRYHRNARNLGFIGACNAGAELAGGEFLVFLNNDTTVQPGWLDALLDTFGRHPDTGLAGSKLVYPDGRLQEAGGIVFADGSGWNYGRFEDPAHPRYNFVREVDYCSGAAIALRRELFMQLGGFDSHYAPAYYEDTDLAMRVRAQGLKVRYQPASVVVHHEGVTSGTDPREGVKSHQASNQKKFLARWREVLAASHATPGSDPELASERGRHRRVLLLDACTPTPDRDSGSMRMLALMRLLREQGCSVLFFPENSAHDGRYTEAIQQLGIEAWWHPYLGDVPRWIARHGHRFDLVIASRHYVLSPLLPLLRTHARRAHLVFDTVDLHHLREQREAGISGDAAQLRAAARTRRIELDLIAQCDTTWVVSAAEQALLARELPDARVEVVSNIHDVHGAGRPWNQRRDLLFVGSYRHPPNVDAALWLASEILPRVRARLPDVVLNLVGGDAPDEVVALGGLPGVRFHGYVPDLLPLLEGARVGVAPLRYGAGVKGKVNQSLAHGQPMVATLCAVEGMHLVHGEDVLVADDAEDFAEAVVRLYQDQALWQKLALGGLENTRRHFSTEPVRATLRALLSTLPRR